MTGIPRIVAGLIGLVALNLLLNAALMWCSEHDWHGEFADRAKWGVLSAQVVLLGYWLALGSGKWYLRLAIVIPGVLLVANSREWQALIVGRRPADIERTAFVTLVYLAVILMCCVALWPLRRLGRFRLTWQPETAISTTRQFQSGDVMLWMVLIGGALALLRMIVLFDGTSDDLGTFVLIVACGLLVAGASMLAAFSTRNLFWRLVVLTCFALVISTPFSAPRIYKRYQNLPGRTWQVFFSAGLRDATEETLPFVSAASVSLASFLALRALGCKLIRPGMRRRTML